MGATQPVVNGGDNYATDKTIQIGAGAATGPILYGLGKTASAIGKGFGSVAQHITNPQSVADANVSRMFGSDP